MKLIYLDDNQLENINNSIRSTMLSPSFAALSEYTGDDHLCKSSCAYISVYERRNCQNKVVVQK